MALSQIQCLDDNHVNPRTHESKPEFLYCEDQRLALEALLRDGREAFFKCLEARGLRGFLSDPELETLAEVVEPYDPGTDLFPEGALDEEQPLSLHYWPELSDTSIPQMDLGWPDCEAYRGVTRTTVYSQPPLDGHAHIKEIVRKTIAQAQKVIGVVMDVFTDVDIFRDLLDAGFKKKVSVYILLERTTLPHFLSMCQRANMHCGHLKNLRVRCTTGAEFYSRSSTRVRGQMGHRFMFVDGDKAVSGSYRFTWMSSRLDKSLITVVTGQAVESFDRLFRTLYSTSSAVDLRKIATEPEPEPEPIPQPAAAAPPSAAVLRKLYNPKYSLVTMANPSPSPADDTQANEKSEDSKNPEEKNKKSRRRAGIEEAPPLHPGLADLEKACLISYLPTWPEPDPPKDVIGFINIRDAKRPNQVHLQRSEMFETSQAIRFSSPITMPKETLPDVAKPRQISATPAQVNKAQATQDKTKNGHSQVVSTSTNPEPGDIKRQGTIEKNLPASGLQSEASKDKTKTLHTDQRLGLNTLANQKGRNPTPHLNVQTLPQSSPNTSIPMHVRPTLTPQTVTTNRPKENSLAGSNTKKETETNSKIQSAKRNSSLFSHTNTNTQSQTHLNTQNSSEITSNTLTPTANGHVSSSNTPCTLSENKNASSSVPPRTSPPANLNLPTPLSALLSTSTPPPVPKPRTIQLLLKDGITSDGKKLQEHSTETPTEVQNRSAVINAVQRLPEKKPEIVPERQNKSVTQKDPESAVNLKEAPRQKESATSLEMKNEEAVGLRDDRIVPEAQPNVSITEPSKAQSVNMQEVDPSNAKPKTLTSKLTEQKDSIVAVQMVNKALEKAQIDSKSAQAPSGNSQTVADCKTNLEKAPEINRILDGVSKPQNKDVSETAKTDTQSTREGKHTPERPFRLQLTDTPVADLRSPDKESRSLSIVRRTPTPDGLLMRTPTPDSRSHTPDPRSYTPDFRTPTPSDGYMSAFESSNVSTTSEEFYECSHSPNLLDSGETQSHNVPGKEAKKEVEKEGTANSTKETKKTGKGDSSEAESTGSSAVESKETPTKTPKKIMVANQSAGKKPVDEGVTPGTLTKAGATTGGPKAKTEATDKEKATLGPSVTVRADKPQAIRETEAQKLLNTPSKSQKEQQQVGEISSPSRLSTSTHPLSGIHVFEHRLLGNSPLNKSDSAAHHGSLQLLNNVSSSRTPPARPPPPAIFGASGLAATRRQTDVSRSQHSLFTQQSDKPRHQISLFHAQSNLQPQLGSGAQNQTLSAQRKPAGQSPFGLTFGKLYSLRDLKDKMSKLPAQSKRGGSSIQGRKSTS